jgi:DNA-binding transcriptional LysR family regulator
MTRNESKYMESVIALSEELNFTRAAQKIGISQPMLTRNIAELEAMLGFQLFERDRKTVRLNDAGRAYLEPARLALLYGERAYQAARSAMQNVDVVLNVGRSPCTNPFLISTLLSVRLRRFPRLRVDWSSLFSYDLIHELLAGTLDLAFLTQPPETPLLTTVQVAESPFYIGISKEDELARQSSLTFEAIANRCWILFERRLHPPLYDSILRTAEAKNVAPARIRHITVPEEAFPFVADATGVAFLAKAGAVRLARNGVTVRPLVEDTLSLKTYLASRADNKSKVASALVRAFMRKLPEPAKANKLSPEMPV